VATFVVVQHGNSETFQILEKWARKPGSDLTLMWDRRTGDRRGRNGSTPVERRVGERQGAVAAVPAYLDEVRRGEQRMRSQGFRSERRQSQRRRSQPATWGVLGFLVVRGEKTAWVRSPVRTSSAQESGDRGYQNRAK